MDLKTIEQKTIFLNIFNRLYDEIEIGSKIHEKICGNLILYDIPAQIKNDYKKRGVIYELSECFLSRGIISYDNVNEFYNFMKICNFEKGMIILKEGIKKLDIYLGTNNYDKLDI